MNEPDRPPLSRNPLRSLLEWLRRQRSGGRTPVKPGRTAEQLQREKLRVQVGVIRRAFRGDVAGASSRGGERAADDADTAYLFRPDHLLVRNDRREDFARFFEQRRDDFEEPMEWPEDSVIDGLMLVPIPKRRDRMDSVLRTLDEMDREFGDGQVAAPDHILYVTSRPSMCPATEPEEPPTHEPWPPQAASGGEVAAQDKVRVSVVDTGLWKDAVGSPVSPWLEADDVFADATDLESVSQSAIHAYAGHGTFVAGVISCLAPETRVEVEGVLTHGGAVYESAICRQLRDALEDPEPPEIISISAGTHTRNGLPPLSLLLLAHRYELAGRSDVLIVAAAGNDDTDEPFWPAAFDWVVGVGSVDPDKKVSDFSSYGKGWVNVYARGRDLVNAFPIGTYTCHEPPNETKVRHFKGLAQWSGTSFSTPVVTGLIAAEMRANRKPNPMSARDAWNAVLKTAIDSHDTRINEDIKIVGPLT
ncbi:MULTISPECIES: S8 family peptidase [unclassified Nocardioides]|uniref:S8 family peptidase n=1 Tax=unclassified Nocardioides TaxID=2615069 RepID=UPI000AE1973F|nr:MULTISPECIES: S8/S53 family peptidase [unclassified Nocardioides]